MASYVDFYWDFGDGNSSTEQNPKHIYKMAGEYLVTRRRTYVIIAPNGDRQEIIDQNQFTIYVYEFDLTGPNNVVYTDLCIRCAVIPQQGIGMVEWGGDGWIWPEAYEGSCNGYDKNNTTISIILDTISGKFYRIGIEEQWLDRLDNFGYVKGLGQEISGYFKLKELTSSQGEFQDIVHNESYVYFRPFFEADRNKSGHNPDNGFREDFHVGMKLYEEGNLTYNTEIEQVPLKADYTFPKKTQARRILAEITFSKSSWRCIGIGQRWNELDKKPAPIINTKSETLWRREFSSPDLWLSRDSTNPLLNRATGSTLDGDYETLTTGPDDTSNSAIDLKVSSSSNVGYSLDMSTSNGGIVYDLDGLEYTVNQNTRKKAKTASYDDKDIQIIIFGSTSNSNIEVEK